MRRRVKSRGSIGGCSGKSLAGYDFGIASLRQPRYALVACLRGRINTMNSAATQPEKALEPKVSPTVHHDPELARWQRKLLPTMTLFVIALAIAFFVLSTRTLSGVGAFIQGEHGELRDQIKEVLSQSQQAGTPDDVIRRGLLLLEADALDRRYHQASALLMSRIWAKHLAFMTGMIMAFMGAIFILGKLSESPTSINSEATQWKLAITSSSPGILLAFFGTALVAISIVIHESIDVRDGPAYLQSVILQSDSPAASKPSTGTVDNNILQKLKGLNGEIKPATETGKK